MRPVLDREIVIDRVINMVNGPGAVDQNNPFAMTRARAERFVDLTKARFQTPMYATSEKSALEAVPEDRMTKDASGLIKRVRNSLSRIAIVEALRAFAAEQAGRQRLRVELVVAAGHDVVVLKAVVIRIEDAIGVVRAVADAGIRG